MPVIPEVIAALDKIKELHKKKNDDYTHNSNPFYNFDIQEDFISQLKSDRDKVFAGMVGLKFARIANLLNQTGQPNNESIEDSFLDMATYILLWRADYIRSKNKSNHHDESLKG